MTETILLINPPIYDFAAYDLFSKPLGLLYLAGLLRRAGYHVEMIDALDRHHPDLIAKFGPPKSKPNTTGKFHSEIIPKPACLCHIPRHYRYFGLPEDLLAANLAKIAQQSQPLAILVSSMMTYWYPAVRDTIAVVRQMLPNSPIALGGIYPTLMPEHAQRVCQPDRLFKSTQIGELFAWLNRLSGHPSGKGIPNAAFSTWPGPAYDLYANLTSLTVLSSLGCPYHCGYCASGVLQPKLQQLGVDEFIDQLTSLLPLLPTQRNRYDIALADDALLAGAQSHFVPIFTRLAQLRTPQPLFFHCPNGLHVRFISPQIAELMQANHFAMIRLSYEGAGESSLGQQASDHKVSDSAFTEALTHLEHAGYRRSQLEAYILTGLPGQDMAEIERSAQAVHDQGLKIKLCQYSPIPQTPLFERACREYGVDPNEPLLHNNSILPTLDKRVTAQTFQRFKDLIVRLNHSL